MTSTDSEKSSKSDSDEDVIFGEDGIEESEDDANAEVQEESSSSPSTSNSSAGEISEKKESRARRNVDGIDYREKYLNQSFINKKRGKI